jgi:hypothetical protein
MTTKPVLGRVRVAVLALCGIAAVAGCAAPLSGAAAGVRQSTTLTAAVTDNVPILVGCGQAAVRPNDYYVSCTPGVSLTKLQWASWNSTEAFAEGTMVLDTCVPNCVEGEGRSFSALVALWGAEPLPGHPGERYFTHLTLIYTGDRTYDVGGKSSSLPQTATYPLIPGV